VKSSNIGMAKLLCRLVEGSPPKGSPQYLPIIEYLHGLGFGRPVFGLPREQRGKVTGLESFDRNYSLVSLSFGHEISVTAFQMAQAIALLIGDGTHRPLRFVRGDRASLPAARPIQLLSPDVTRDVRRMMRAVVEEGATRKLRPRGYSMGGKTGTAEKDRDRSKNTMSFFCFAPVEKPVVAVLAVVDEPKKHRFASEVAAPVASKILSEALKSMEVPPDREWEIAEGDGVVGMAGGSR